MSFSTTPPLPSIMVSNAAVKTVTSPAANVTTLIAAANPKRKAFSIYNNSTNSLYVGVESDVSGGNQIGQCASNAGPTAHFYSGQVGAICYTGALYAKRNTGTGTIIVWEFE